MRAIAALIDLQKDIELLYLKYKNCHLYDKKN